MPPLIGSRARSRTPQVLVTLQFIGDGIFAFFGLSIAYFLRFETFLKKVGVDAVGVTYLRYVPLMTMGSIFFVGTLAYLNLYDAKLLLRPKRAISITLRAVIFWMAAYLSCSLVLKFDPPISRLFVAIGCLTTIAVTVCWRSLFHQWLSRSRFRKIIVQRVLIIGWGDEARKLAANILIDRNHTYAIAGYIATKGESADELSCPLLGTLDDLEPIFEAKQIDVAVVADVALTSSQILNISSLCERLYVQFKILPTFFRIFISNLRLQAVSGVPLLGIEGLSVTSHTNAMIKRGIDIFGALVGLLLSGPIVAVVAVLIKRESPGPVVFKQVRTGRHGHPFVIYKLRSMRLDAEKDTGARWAVRDDPRRLKIGAIIRKWNLDELPQFWNVLKGDMSLVGPRPEMTDLIDQFVEKIPHYNPRHEVRPGLTGWAQVNGLRGNTSLPERIRHDLYYIENWSIWLDVQILALTFIRRKNAY